MPSRDLGRTGRAQPAAGGGRVHPLVHGVPIGRGRRMARHGLDRKPPAGRGRAGGLRPVDLPCIPFDCPEIRRAFERLGTILFTPGFVHGGISAVGGDRIRCQRSNPWSTIRRAAGCTSSRLRRRLPPCRIGRDPDRRLPFPRVTDRSSPAMLGGGDMVAAFCDRPEVREVVRYFLGPATGRDRGGRRGHVRQPPVRTLNYAPFWRRQADCLIRRWPTTRSGSTRRISCRPRSAKIVLGRDDDLRGEGPESLDPILAELDAAWPDE